MRYLFLAIALFLVTSAYALAQAPTAEPTTQPTDGPVAQPPPANTQDLVNGVTALITTFAGLLGSAVTNLIRQIPGLSGDDQSKLQSAATQIIAVLVSVATGFAVAAIAQGLDLIPDSGTQALIVAISTPVVAEAKHRLTAFSAKA